MLLPFAKLSPKKILKDQSLAKFSTIRQYGISIKLDD